MANPKGNPQNLVNIGDRPKEEIKAITSKGGKACAEKKKKKKTMREVAKAFLDLNLSDKKKEEIKKSYNLNDDEMLTYRFPLVASLYYIIGDKEENAQNKIAAMRFLIELAGESPSQIAAKEAIESQLKLEVEDDPFSKSIKEMFGGDGK